MQLFVWRGEFLIWVAWTTSASRPTDVHVFRSLVPQPVLVLIVLSTCLTPIIFLLVHSYHQTADCVIVSIVDARVSKWLRSIELTWPENCATLISLPQFDRLILIIVESHVGSAASPRAKVVYGGRFKLRLRLRPQVKHIDILVNHGLFMRKFFLLLLLLQLLILPHQTLLKYARGDAKLELVFFDLIFEEFYDFRVRSILLLNVHADVSGAQFMLLDRSLVLLSQLIKHGIVRSHLPCKSV